jgi:hypothetical protein
VTAPKIHVALSHDEAALLLEALADLGAATPDYDKLKATTELAARIRTSARKWGAEWLYEHP